MRDIGRIVRQGGTLYATIPSRIVKVVALRAGDRMAVITDGRTIAMSKIPIEEIVNRAMLKRAVDDAG